MTASTVRDLVNLEGSFVRAQVLIADLARDVARVAGELPCCSGAIRDLVRVRRALKRTLATLDEPITNAVVLQLRLDGVRGAGQS